MCYVNEMQIDDEKDPAGIWPPMEMNTNLITSFPNPKAAFAEEPQYCKDSDNLKMDDEITEVHEF